MQLKIPAEDGKMRDQRMRKRVTAIIDETGPNDIFAVGATITDKPEEFADISRKLREKLGVEELKYRKSSKETKDIMEKALTDIGAEVEIRYIKKGVEGDFEWWMQSGSERQQGMLKELAKDLVELDVDFDKIIIDDNTAMKGDAGKMIIEEYVSTVREIGLVSQESSERGKHKDLLQTNDFAIGTSGRVLRGIKSKTGIRIRFRRMN